MTDVFCASAAMCVCVFLVILSYFPVQLSWFYLKNWFELLALGNLCFRSIFLLHLIVNKTTFLSVMYNAEQKYCTKNKNRMKENGVYLKLRQSVPLELHFNLIRLRYDSFTQWWTEWNTFLIVGLKESIPGLSVYRLILLRAWCQVHFCGEFRDTIKNRMNSKR